MTSGVQVFHLPEVVLLLLLTFPTSLLCLRMPAASGANLTFTYTVTDACGSQTCTSAFTVAPNTPPVILCPPSPQVRTLEPNERRYRTVGNEFDYISISDDCGTPIISNNLNNRNYLGWLRFPIRCHNRYLDRN